MSTTEDTATTDPAVELARQLREVADLIEANPHLAAKSMSPAATVSFYPSSSDTGTAAGLIRLLDVKLAKPADQYSTYSAVFDRREGVLAVRLTVPRSAVQDPDQTPQVPVVPPPMRLLPAICEALSDVIRAEPERVSVADVEAAAERASLDDAQVSA